MQNVLCDRDIILCFNQVLSSYRSYTTKSYPCKKRCWLYSHACSSTTVDNYYMDTNNPIFTI